METQSESEYYQDKTLSVSSVKLFAQNPARALADYNGTFEWFKGDNEALLIGRYFHDLMQVAVEKFMDKEFVDTYYKNNDLTWLNQAKKDAYEFALEFVKENSSEEYQSLIAKTGKTKGQLKAKPKEMLNWFEALWFSRPLDDIIVNTVLATKGINQHDAFVEKDFKSEYKGVTYKGKLDFFTVDHDKKIIYAYDYKTSKAYDPSGIEYGTDIFGVKRKMPVEWTVEKLFPWQAGVYRQLLRDNGYADYKLVYRYLVVTKQVVPRLEVFVIDDDCMDLGFEQFATYLLKANDYINGKEVAPLIQDGSDYANQQTYQHPITRHPNSSDGQVETPLN